MENCSQKLTPNFFNLISLTDYTHHNNVLLTYLVKYFIGRLAQLIGRALNL